jgi:hypothetical protein
MLSLDLNELVGDWDCAPGELAARQVRGRDGTPLLQLRVDLGVLQMRPDGRPDGTRYRGLPGVLAYIEHERRAGHDVFGGEHWQALDRELAQLNYRRLALTALAEEALREGEEGAARQHLLRAVRDIAECERVLRCQQSLRGHVGPHGALWPVLAFNHARLLCQLNVLERDYAAAVEACESGAETLRALVGELSEEGGDGDEVGAVYLEELARQLRVQYEVEETLAERLAAALEREDYEAAKALQAEMKEREETRRARLREVEGE